VRALTASKRIRVIEFGNLIVGGQRFYCRLTVNAPDTLPHIMSRIVERISKSKKPLAKPAPKLRQTLRAKQYQDHCQDRNDLPAAQKGRNERQYGKTTHDAA